ncbi:mRNA cleavage and polyadenylation factor subunit [Malassezia cuniculi]|uniref:mRNA cleavage and polyadenylation factor subunit n=1 Tax=Malassezia cuniculi TaxID=948313 RepID=A0AAF0J6Y3_9BASI|nr:mRNA cleavage and polyadenylation factor subunit [Malassezia cuniculi]
MADVWVSRRRWTCKYCNVTVNDDVPSRRHHENGVRHKQNVEQALKNLYRESQIRRTSSGAPTPKVARDSSAKGTFENYSTAESLGYSAADDRDWHDRFSKRVGEATVGEWQAVAPQHNAEQTATAGAVSSSRETDTARILTEREEARRFELVERELGADDNDDDIDDIPIITKHSSNAAETPPDAPAVKTEGPNDTECAIKREPDADTAVPTLPAGPSADIKTEAEEPHSALTSIQRIRTIASLYDRRDRVLISFRDAKLALMEWNDAYGDLTTVSIHTFERAPQLAAGVPHNMVPVLAADPASRCAALLLPQDAIAVLPLYQDMSEMSQGDENRGVSAALLNELPYAPSFVLSLAEDVDKSIKNVSDLAFLPGLQKPTLALLFRPQLTWTGNLSRERDTVRVCIVTLDVTVSRFPLTLTSEPLPYDSLYIRACPASIGGLLVVTPSAILHVDQTARVVGLAVSGWFGKTSGISIPQYGEELDLQDSQLIFTSGSEGLLFLADGRAFALSVATEGRSVTGISLSALSVPGSAPPTAFTTCIGDYIFCGAIVGDSRLYTMETGSAQPSAPAPAPAPAPIQPVAAEPMDDVDADLYGASAPAPTPAPAAPATTSSVAAPIDDDDLYGDSAPVPAPRAAASLHLADTLPTLAPISSVARGTIRDDRGMTERTIVTGGHQLVSLEPKLRFVEARDICPARDIWTAGGLLLTTSDDESLMHTQDGEFVAQLEGATIECGGDVFTRVTSTDAEQFAQDGKLVARFGARDTPIVGARCVGQYTALLYADEVHIFHGSSPGGTIRGAYVHVDIYADGAGALFGQPGTFLVLVDRAGSIHLFEISRGVLIWRSRSLRVLPSRLNGSDGTAEPDDQPGDDVTQIRMCTIGDMPSLVVMYASGHLAIFEARPAHDDDGPQVGIPFGFVRLESRVIHSAGRLALVVFGGQQAVVVPGTTSIVILRDAKGGLQLRSLDIQLEAAAALGPWRLAAVQHGGARLVSFEAVALDGPVPYIRWSTGREYSHVAVHSTTGCIVAASVQPIDFVLYGDDEAPVQDPALDPGSTKSVRGAIELFPRLGEEPNDGYELGPNETVLALHTPDLDCQDRPEGRRQFVVAGTVTSTGEDRTAKGHFYVFEISGAVPFPEDRESDTLRLRLLCREETRAPVTALSDLNGFLVAAVGQKLLVRSFEYQSWLVTIAFYDTAFYVTDIKRLKSVLLLTDIHRSTYFIAFQEEPAKLLLLGRDYNIGHRTAGAFLIDGRTATLVTAAPDGCLRLLDFNPSNPTSHGGQRLLVRTEYHSAGSVTASMILRHAYTPDGEPAASEVMLVKQNGAIDMLVPVPERTFNTLQLFQSMLVRSVRHTAGLNPRAFRAVANEHVSRPLAKGILDGQLLHMAENMSRPKFALLVQDLQLRSGGATDTSVLRDLSGLLPVWSWS